MSNWSNFNSRVIYELEGWVQSEGDTEKFTRATEVELTTESRLKFDEKLKANIVNLDSWFRQEWTERLVSPIDVDDEQRFIVDWKDATVRLDLRQDELEDAAYQRATEDSTEAVYVLADWVYQAKKADHIPICTDLEMAYKTVADRDDQPDDSDPTSYRGGRDD